MKLLFKLLARMYSLPHVATIAHVCGPVYHVSFLYHVLGSMRVVFSTFDSRCCCFGKLWTLVLGTKQSVRIAFVQIHSFGSCIYLVHFNVCRKPGLAEPERLKFGCSK